MVIEMFYYCNNILKGMFPSQLEGRKLNPLSVVLWPQDQNCSAQTSSERASLPAPVPSGAGGDGTRPPRRESLAKTSLVSALGRLVSMKALLPKISKEISAA